MSMSTHVIGFVPPDEMWLKMKKIWDACQEAGVHVPSEVDMFFDGCIPDPSGQEMKILHREWISEKGMRDGIEIDVKSIPKQVKTIRFYNSW